ncbi:MAG: EAL domain-containing protein [Betaproteobacteria bacterium]|nr:EAL domain-containing protein [Betaproteobacteria bacterium]
MAVIHLALLVPARLGWLTPVAYTAAVALLSGLVAGAFVALSRRAGAAAGGSDIAADSAAAGSLPELHPALMELQRRSRERLQALKRSHEQERERSEAHQRAAEHLKRAQRIARVGSWEWQRTTQRMTCSEEVHRLLGLAPGSVLSAAGLLELVHEDDRRAFRRWVLDVARGRSSHGLDLRVRPQEGEEKYVHVLGEALRAGGRVVGVAGTVQDATERTQAIQQIHKLAYYDVLTELPNRSRFHEKLAETLELAHRADRSFALLFLDLDQFKRINDTLGHHVGDDLLRIVAQRLKGVVRADGAAVPRGGTLERDVCRQGGDEFIVLLDGVTNEEQAARAAQRVIERLAQPIAIGGQELFVSASIGIVLYPRDGEDLDALLRNADVAMYHAKSEGRNCFAFYDASMRQATARRLSLEQDLRRAIEGEQFVLHYQPQIDMASGRIVGMEALVRWNHPTLGLLWPQHFIGVAEEAGLIGAIWEWVFVTALIQHNAWREEGLPPIPIGVNLSSVQFAEGGLAKRVTEIAEVVGVPFEHIELELTESALVKDWDKAVATLEALRATGIRIAVDDFGTGYSSLSYLRRLPFDKLKLDHALTADASGNPKGAAIARAIVAMAHSLELTVVAEGVETQQQIDVLTAMGCTTMQGYLLSRPLTVEAMSELLHRRFHERGTIPALDRSACETTASP